MKKILIFTALLAIASIGFAGVAKADSTTAGGVVYTFTNSGPDGSGGFLVTVQIDGTSAVSAASLPLFSVQFFDGATSSTNASISSGPSGWSVVGFGNVNQCGTGSLPFICSEGPGLAVGGTGDVYTFVFDVTGLPGTPTNGDIQAFQHVDGDLAISNGVGIGAPPSVPEPASLTLLGLGLFGVPFLRRRK
jgi:hypothetical protein